MSEEDIQNVEGETAAEGSPTVSLDAINQNVVRSIPITLNVEVGRAKLKLKELMLNKTTKLNFRGKLPQILR